MILHIPHSGTKIKKLEEYITTEPQSQVTDWYTDDLFSHDCFEPLIFEYSRLWCDVERFRKDDLEKIGMGFYYTKANNKNIRPKIKETLKEVACDYEKWHLNLEQKIKNHLNSFGTCGIVDCHSFNTVPLLHEEKEEQERPQFCIGTTHKTPKGLGEKLVKQIEEQGYTAMINFPYCGTLVPEKYNQNKNVWGIMIEVNKSLYLKNQNSMNPKKSKDYNRTKGVINTLLNTINKENNV